MGEYERAVATAVLDLPKKHTAEIERIVVAALAGEPVPTDVSDEAMDEAFRLLLRLGHAKNRDASPPVPADRTDEIERIIRAAQAGDPIPADVSDRSVIDVFRFFTDLARVQEQAE